MKKLSVIAVQIFLWGSTGFAQQFKVSYTATAFKGPFSGHVILYLSKTKKEPRAELDEPCYGIIVNNVKPGEQIVFDDKAIFYPSPLTRLDRGTYYIQAVWDRDLGGRQIGTSPGNMYSNAVQVTFGDDTTQVTPLVCGQVAPQPVFVESTYDRELKVKSKLLSKFHHKTVTVDAAVIVPKEYYTEPRRKFPVLFNIAGFGGDYHHYSKENGDTSASSPFDTTACIKVYMDGNCPLGHSTYANSDNNGPWGDALVKEFIPELEKNYRCNGAFLGKGHSSGGWAVLWLQTHYPKVFAGINASAPDFVDLRMSHRGNIYEGKPIKVTPRFEDVVYRGEQGHSLDAVYGLKGADGNPKGIHDYATGQMNMDVLDHWKQYDISLYLRENWQRLKSDLGDKIRISVGEQDTYGLNKPIHLMEDEMKKIGATIAFAYYPGTHFTVTTPAYRHDQDLWLEAKYQEWLTRTQK